MKKKLFYNQSERLHTEVKERIYAGVVYDKLHKEFTIEEDFVETEEAKKKIMAMDEILVDQNGLLKIKKELELIKATRPDGVAGWILRENAKQVVGLRVSKVPWIRCQRNG